MKTATPSTGAGLAKRGSLLIAIAFAAIIVLASQGGLRSLDDALRDLRFSAQSRSATGGVVFVDIDQPSLASVGVWPWPRHIHADVLDELMRLGADDVVFDIDFSVASEPAEDERFAAALREAGGYAYLAAFQQQTRQGSSDTAAFNLPYEKFRQFAQPAAVNVSLDVGGLVRTYPFAMSIGGVDLPSVASLLSASTGPVGGGFDIDYSIDPKTVDRIAVSEVLAGRVPQERIAGKQVIVGASAVELRDYFVVPRFGILPGALLQALATETLKQHRALQPLPCLPGLLAIAGIAGLALMFRRRIPLPLALVGTIVASGIAEAAALLLQTRFALLADTAGFHFATATFVLTVLISELVKRGQQKRAADDRLRYLSCHDPLTGAVSRLRLTEIIGESAGRDIALIMIDLRRFRIINDSLGHSQGDLLLKQVVMRLEGAHPDAVARLGGDSFAMLISGMPAERLGGFCNSVTEWISSPYELANGHQAIIAASAGATTSGISGHDPEILLSHADMALSAAKQAPGNGVALFLPEMDDRLKQRTAMDAALRTGLAERQFSLAYQPQIDLRTGRLVGVEALARWRTAALGSVSPLLFVAAAEETGLIVELGRWALLTACRDATAWPEDISVAVNVSPVQFELTDIVADVTAALSASGLPPSRLELEITEGTFVRNVEAVTRRLDALRGIGVRIALDDFGTGYSSLSYLGNLPVDKLKIDRSFISRLPGDAEAEAIVRAVVALARALGKTVIAEGIETASQAAMLEAIGCPLAQGYHFGRPVPALDIAMQIDALRPKLAATG
jgi:diguanylate cyclase (GGDEF)-like protein